MQRIAYFFTEAWRGLWHHRALTFTALASLAGALSVLGLFLALTSNAQRALASLGDRREIVVFLRDTSTPEEQLALRQRMSAQWGEAIFVSKEQAWADFARELGGTELLEAVGQNPLPASIRLKLRPELLTFDRMQQVATALANEPIVEEVRFGGEWVQRLDRFIETLRFLDLVIGAAVAVAVVFIVANTIRLTIVARREILRVMALVGAGDSFVRLPLLIEGMLEALLAAIVALGALYAITASLEGRLAGVSYLPWAWSLSFLGFAALLGWFGSFVALLPLTRKH